MKTTNMTSLLDQRLEVLESRSQAIIEAASQTIELPFQNEILWPDLLAQYGTENAIFERLGIDKALFIEVYALVKDVAGETRGRRSKIRTNREKLLFLMIYMSKGVGVLETLVHKLYKTREHIHERAKAFAVLFKDNITQGTIRHFDEYHDAVPGASLVVDCTVCPIMRPKRSFKEAKVFFSGKHWFYALKKEVCVNIRSGTAAIVSPSFPGSVHDVVILRSHSDQINNVLQGRSLLADLGYHGTQHDVPTIIVCGAQDRALRALRVQVECFFGRLKSLWMIFSSTWALYEEEFDLFFDIACGLTNVHILRHPLREVDAVFDKGVLNLIKAQQKSRIDAQKLANENYRRRRHDELDDGAHLN